MPQRLIPALSLTFALLAFGTSGCGPSKPATTGTSAVPGNKEEEPRVIIEESSEVWYDQTAGSDGS